MTVAGLEITDDGSRFVGTLDGEEVGFATYSRTPDQVIMPHTVTEPEYEGRGIASAIIKVALDDARSRGLKVVPVCPFVSAYLDRHPEYADIDSRK